MIGGSPINALSEGINVNFIRNFITVAWGRNRKAE
jgi:hypothetical protein